MSFFKNMFLGKKKKDPEPTAEPQAQSSPVEATQQQNPQEKITNTLPNKTPLPSGFKEGDFVRIKTECKSYRDSNWNFNYIDSSDDVEFKLHYDERKFKITGCRDNMPELNYYGDVIYVAFEFIQPYTEPEENDDNEDDDIEDNGCCDDGYDNYDEEDDDDYDNYEDNEDDDDDDITFEMLNSKALISIISGCPDDWLYGVIHSGDYSISVSEPERSAFMTLLARVINENEDYVDGTAVFYLGIAFFQNYVDPDWLEVIEYDYDGNYKNEALEFFKIASEEGEPRAYRYLSYYCTNERQRKKYVDTARRNGDPHWYKVRN